jgi:hypothetical protein
LYAMHAAQNQVLSNYERIRIGSLP